MNSRSFFNGIIRFDSVYAFLFFHLEWTRKGASRLLMWIHIDP